MLSQDCEAVHILSVLPNESVYSVASYASYRLDKLIGRHFDAKAVSIALDSSDFQAQRTENSEQFRRIAFRYRRVFLLISDLFMELHDIEADSGRSLGQLARYSNVEISALLDAAIHSILVISEQNWRDILPSKATEHPQTVPFQCVEEFEACKSAKRGKPLCSAALTICLLQCVIPLAKGASSGVKNLSNDVESDQE